MVKKYLIASIVTFIIWSVLDFLLHGLWLKETYESTAELWRPMEEVPHLLAYGTSLITAFVFCAIYGFLVNPRTLRTGTIYGALIGLLSGVPMGLGTYAYTPIPLFLAFAWLGITVLNMTIAGTLNGFIQKSE